MIVQINLDRLMSRIMELGKIGALEKGGVKRLALTDEDRMGRDLVCRWMAEAGLTVTTDLIGNTWGIREGREDDAPVIMGSHIDSVATGGLYDGVLGVLAGLEVIESLNDAGIPTKRPVGMAFFTNEEGARFAPDMMGSGVAQKALDLDEMLAVTGIDGTTVREELNRIGYAGTAPVMALRPHCFLELHVEQGPVLENENVAIGAVTGVQGISWTEYVVEGRSSHAGTTPMTMRRDAGVVAARIAAEARAIADDFGAPQVATVGMFELSPGLVNVVPERAMLTVDLRNTDDALLLDAETRLNAFAETVAAAEDCTLRRRSLARFAPVEFDQDLVAAVEEQASALGHTVRRMPSGAGHDAQMFAPNCPTAMIFVPSRDGLSHNIHEFTAPEQIGAGVDVLMQVVLNEAGTSR
ncbi:M20 family metallo-hydrolase [Rhodobacteraceae bacterium F11138]|nr:M20 family metallo-hydrolase [Rhodobacteraceae bacterium F11138]